MPACGLWATNGAVPKFSSSLQSLLPCLLVSLTLSFPIQASLTLLDTFLYGFLIPMLSYMFESRLQIDPSQTQRFTSSILALHGIVSAVSSPVIGHFADKTDNRKSPLLFSITGCILGTAMVAFTHSVAIFFLGRILQGVAGSAVWIVGMASVANTVGKNNMGAVMGIAMSFINAGMISGPMVSGLIFDAAGYWLTWSVPLVILTVNAIMRLVMVENSDYSFESSTKLSEAAETTTLLPSSDDLDDVSTTLGFWRLLFRDSRVVTAFLVAFSSACTVTSFHATLPLHVQEVFGWGPGRVGMLFSCLSIPGIFIGPVAGWIRDCIGVRTPAAASLVLQAGILVLIGVAGNDRFAWASSQTTGPLLYTISITAMGIMRPFVAGLGPVEVIGRC